MDYNKALSFAKDKHKGQFRKHGPAYITHPLRVVEILRNKNINDEDTILGGLFHDLLEDTNATKEEIIYYSNPRVLKIVEILTKDEAYEISSYIYKVSQCQKARLIKLADRLSNLEDILFLDDKNFLNSYYDESFKYFLELGKATVFEEDIRLALTRLKKHMESLRIY